ncbi:hypothetical protein BH23VER1_BH23VER1_16940 [soil metagenome]
MLKNRDFPTLTPENDPVRPKKISRAMNAKETAPLAIASLALSCLGALSVGILAIPGIVCACIAKKQVRRGEHGGYALAQAGLIVGIAVLILWILIPIVVLGGAGLLALAFHEPWIAAGVVTVVTLLGLLPTAFTSMARRRDSKSLQQLVKQNRARS